MFFQVVVAMTYTAEFDFHYKCPTHIPASSNCRPAKLHCNTASRPTCWHGHTVNLVIESRYKEGECKHWPEITCITYSNWLPWIDCDDRRCRLCLQITLLQSYPNNSTLYTNPIIKLRRPAQGHQLQYNPFWQYSVNCCQGAMTPFRAVTNCWVRDPAVNTWLFNLLICIFEFVFRQPSIYAL